MSFGRTRFISQNQSEKNETTNYWDGPGASPRCGLPSEIYLRSANDGRLELFYGLFLCVRSWKWGAFFFSKKWKGSKPLRLTKSQYRTAVTSNISCFLEVEVEEHPYHPWDWYICLHFTIKKNNHSCRQLYRSHGSCGWIDSRNSILSTWPILPPFFVLTRSRGCEPRWQVWFGIP